jgi:hypothetical protein
MEENIENVSEVSAENTVENLNVQQNKKDSLSKRMDAFLDKNYALFFAPILGEKKSRPRKNYPRVC